MPHSPPRRPPRDFHVEGRAASPDGRLEVAIGLDGDGAPHYRVERDGREVLRPSRLGFEFRAAPALREGFEVEDVGRREVDERWTPPWGETAEVRSRCSELRAMLREREGGRRLEAVVRVFDDGLGLRLEIPRQAGLERVEITGELTEFALAGNHRAWWIPAYREDRFELLYSSSPASTLGTVHTPLTLESADGLHLALHEAALDDYASMTLSGSRELVLDVELVPWADGGKVRGETPIRTPWRTLLVADDAGGLLESTLSLRLNEPSRMEETDWIRPMKYVGIWWGMHIGRYTWAPGPRHGATTERAKRYVDFAAEHGLGGVLVEGWNVGWTGTWWEDGTKFDFTEPTPDFDLAEVVRYARERGVEIIGHHETSAAVEHYEERMEEAFAFYRELGIRVVKTGYVGERTRDGEWHHGQRMVRHHRRVAEAAARHGIALDVHEPVKDTGERRTWPNVLTREGARGQEYNAWSVDGGNPPEHETILAFTRMLSGPMDFTPGIFDLTVERGRGPRGDRARVNTTLAKQLALYVVLYSPLQMAADLPENYEGHPAFAFLRDVPVDWSETRVPHGRIGDYVTVVRRERDGPDWYLGSITDEEGRTLELELDFLAPDLEYEAEIYRDAPRAHWRDSPHEIEVRRERVVPGDRMVMGLAPGGGQAVRFRAL